MKLWQTLALVISTHAAALSSVEEKTRLLDMLAPVGEIVDRIAAHNIWHYEKTGFCDAIGLKGTLILPAEETTQGQVSGNLLRYIFTDYDDCHIYLQFQGVPDTVPEQDAAISGRSYEYRLDNIMLMFRPVMEHTQTGQNIPYNKDIHTQEADLYTIADWSCEILHVIPVNESNNHYDAYVEEGIKGSTPHLLDQEVRAGDPHKPHPFTYIKTINGEPVLINFSHELPGKMLKKCRSFRTS